MFKKLKHYLIKTLGLRGSWKWAKKQMMFGGIIKRESWIGSRKLAIDNPQNKLLLVTHDHLDKKPVWERAMYHLSDEDHIDYYVTGNVHVSYGGIDMTIRKIE